MMMDDASAPQAIPNAYVPQNSSIQAPDAAPVDPPSKPQKTAAPIIAYFKAERDAAVKLRKTLASGWKANIEARLGIHGRTVAVTTGDMSASSGELQSEINPDWALTKTKTANLYSQTPRVYLRHQNPAYAPAMAPFSRALNYEIGEKRAKVGVAMEETLNDVVNAAGVAGVYVGYAARFGEPKHVPTIDTTGMDPAQVEMGMQMGMIPFKDVPQLVSDRIFASRLSPNDLLWPRAFAGSDFDEGPWIGYSGVTSWAEAKNEWKLKESDRERIIRDEDKPSEEDLRTDPDKQALVAFNPVRFDRIFYWRYKVDPEEKNFKAIWELVFVNGLDAPVIDRPWVGQEMDATTGKYVGATRFPVRILTLTYISDNPIPPSDTAVGSPQRRDMVRSRQQMFLNRDRSAPMRWFDVNRVDRLIQDRLMLGDFQGAIPTNGDGSRALGEIARASYPAENMAFDRQAKADLQESWQISAAQLGVVAAGERTKGEVDTTQQNFATNMGRERNRVANFFLGIVEVIAGYMVLNSEFTILSEEERAAMQEVWDNKTICHDLVFSILPDSTIVLDSEQRIARLQRLINATAMSGVVDVTPLIIELTELHGVDPATIMKKPEAPKPPEASISYRFSGKEDLYNPIVAAILKKNGQFPSDEEIEAAKKALLLTAAPPGTQPVQPETPPAPEGAPFNENAQYQLPPTVMKRERDVEG
ncbi:MAG: hypothetical protein ABL993_09385 [Vicinamibacterales bacterium]